MPCVRVLLHRFRRALRPASPASPSRRYLTAAHDSAASPRRQTSGARKAFRCHPGQGAAKVEASAAEQTMTQRLQPQHLPCARRRIAHVLLLHRSRARCRYGVACCAPSLPKANAASARTWVPSAAADCLSSSLSARRCSLHRPGTGEPGRSRSRHQQLMHGMVGRARGTFPHTGAGEAPVFRATTATMSPSECGESARSRRVRMRVTRGWFRPSM